MSNNVDELTQKQEMFCQYYVATNNGTNSAEQAGYSKKTAGVQASRLLKDVKIQNRINEIRSEVLSNVKHDQEQIVHWLYDIANPVNGEHTGNRIKALELLGKYHAMFTEKRYVESQNTTTIIDDLSSLSQEEIDEALKALESTEVVEDNELFPKVVDFPSAK